jgi:hypothetical protein
LVVNIVKAAKDSKELIDSMKEGDKLRYFSQQDSGNPLLKIIKERKPVIREFL